MTALIYVIEKDQLRLAMDTLIVSADDKSPLEYQNKFVVFPNVNVVIAGTGLAEFIYSWFLHLENKICDIGFDQLIRSSSSELLHLERQCKNFEITDSTVYQFGYSEQEQCYAGFAFRSPKHWVAERLPYDSLGYKPQVELPQINDVNQQTFVEIMVEQRRVDLTRPVVDRVGIGGDVQLVTMSGGAITVEQLHRFDGYEDDLRIMEQKRMVTTSSR